MRERAKSLDEQAAKLRRLAQDIHEHRVVAELVQALKGEEADIDLSRAALLIAKLDNEELDIEPYLHEVRRMGEEIAGKLAHDAGDEAKLAALRKYLFEENGFHGSRGDYYNRSNSYLNEVLDDREGLPITLSVLYMELAAKLGLKVLGLGLPGHFIVEYVPAEGPPQLIDVYEGANPMSRDDAARRVRSIADRELADADLVPMTKRAILVHASQSARRGGSGPRQRRSAALFERHSGPRFRIGPRTLDARRGQLPTRPQGNFAARRGMALGQNAARHRPGATARVPAIAGAR